jgi:type I restriction enzyme M protein
MITEKNIVAILWEHCNTLRHAGVSYGSYIEQITFLLFLKMAHERRKEEEDGIDPEYSWNSLKDRTGSDLKNHYEKILKHLSSKSGLLGIIFRNAQNKIEEPAQLRSLIKDLVEPVNWSGLKMDVLGDAYEGLLQKNADDAKSGAGQYFTPRTLIKAIVTVMQPQPGQRICDPACGTGGFLLAASDYLTNTQHTGLLDRDEKKGLAVTNFHGYELVPETARICAMNLFLHGIGGINNSCPITIGDSLRKLPSERYDIVLSNPPFGQKGEKGDRGIARDDFWATTSNKQLNFLQHIVSLLEIDGKAAVVLPDNVLFVAGAGKTIRERLLATCDVHTLLRLPTGIFYKQGVKANVLFFDKRKASREPQTSELWIYDLRTNKNFTLHESPMKDEDLADFIKCFNPDNRRQREESERFRKFTYDELLKRDKLDLNITWLRDNSIEDVEELPPPRVLAKKMYDDLSAILEEMRLLAKDLGADLEEEESEENDIDEQGE